MKTINFYLPDIKRSSFALYKYLQLRGPSRNYVIYLCRGRNEVPNDVVEHGRGVPRFFFWVVHSTTYIPPWVQIFSFNFSYRSKKICRNWNSNLNFVNFFPEKIISITNKKNWEVAIFLTWYFTPENKIPAYTFFKTRPTNVAPR